LEYGGIEEWVVEIQRLVPSHQAPRAPRTAGKRAVEEREPTKGVIIGEYFGELQFDFASIIACCSGELTQAAVWRLKIEERVLKDFFY
jgi:hypothetical protein